MAVELMPHQAKAIENMSNGKILTGGVGSGKTVTALAYFWTHVLGGTLNDFNSPKKSVDLYIFTTAMKRDSLDWQTWASRFCINEDPAQSVMNIKLVVDSYNNIGKYTDVKGAFLILDEQRMVGSGAWTQAFVHMAKSNDWIMLSATPGDKWEDYIPVFLANGFYKNRAQFKREHCVYSYYGRYPKLERYIGVNKLVKLEKSILVDMPFERHTVRHLTEVPVDYDIETFNKVVKKRWNPYEERPLRDVAELFATMRKVVNSDTSRLEALRSLMQKHPRLIVYYNFDYELMNLRSLADSLMSQDSEKGKLWNSTWTSSSTSSGSLASNLQTGSERDCSSFSVAEWNGHKHEPVPESDSWLYLVQYAAGAEAWNCTTTDAIVFYSLTYSYKHFEQSQGRIDRLDTPYVDLWYYMFVSDSLIDKMVRKSLKAKKNFNEKDYRVNT